MSLFSKYEIQRPIEQINTNYRKKHKHTSNAEHYTIYYIVDGVCLVSTQYKRQKNIFQFASHVDCMNNNKL